MSPTEHPEHCGVTPNVTPATCAGCGVALVPSRRGPRRKWCSERCRKASYGDPCVDCGARTCYGAEAKRRPDPRCNPCAKAHYKRWPQEAILAAVWAWNERYGEPPAVTDWNPYEAERVADLQRLERFRAGNWPTFMTVIEAFGSWNAAIEAAGCAPRSAGGGNGNSLRLRRARTRRERLPQLIALWHEGLTMKQIADQLGVSWTVVADDVVKFRAAGHDLPYRRRPKLTPVGEEVAA